MTNARLHLCLWVIAAVAGSGCGALGGGGVERTSQNVILAPEIEADQTATDAYVLVQRLRPLWLHRRGPKSILFDGDIVVYEGQMPTGPPSSLRYISVTDIQSVRFLKPGEANTIFGTGHPYGAIVVQRRDS